MSKIKTILGIFIFSVLVAAGASGDAMASDAVIDKIEVSYPVSLGATVTDDMEITAYVDGVVQDVEINANSEIEDTQGHTVSTGATFGKKGYSLYMSISAPSGYRFTCDDDDNFVGTITVNGEAVKSFDFCYNSVVEFYFGFDFRDYYDITKLNFDLRYPVATSVAGDINATQLSSLDGLSIEYGGWYKYDTNCDFDEDFEDVYMCWYENKEEMDDDEGFVYGEQYTYVFFFDHPDYYFHNIEVEQYIAELPKYANINGVPTLTGVWTDMVVDEDYMVFLNIPELKDYLTVTFDTQGIGVAPETQNITPNTTITEPAMTADGYMFDGWYYDEDCTLPVDFDMIITNDVTFYAKWTSVVGAPDTGTETESLSLTMASVSVGVLAGIVVMVAVVPIIVRRRSGRKH